MTELTSSERSLLSREERLIGQKALNLIASKKVIIFGVGGVGGWCAESLVRSGIRHLTIIDSDRVSLTNCNRQLAATSHTVGMPKVKVIKERLLEINPDAEITAIENIYSKETAEAYHLERFDYVIDAIDSLEHKARLIIHATKTSKAIDRKEISGNDAVSSLKIFSSMGAALRTDPFAVSSTEFWKIEGDPLAKSLRKKFKHWEEYPYRKFTCVYSKELPMKNQEPELCHETDSNGISTSCTDQPSLDNMQKEMLENHDWDKKKAQINGTVSHVVAIFGFSLAGLVINDIIKESQCI